MSISFLSQEVAHRSPSEKYSSPANLHEAIYWGNYKVAEDMIRSGADVNAKDEKLRTPLHYAAAVVGRRREVKLLLRNQADPTTKDIDGETPIDWATECHQERHLQLLTSKIADLIDCLSDDF